MIAVKQTKCPRLILARNNLINNINVLNYHQMLYKSKEYL